MDTREHGNTMHERPAWLHRRNMQHNHVYLRYVLRFMLSSCFPNGMSIYYSVVLLLHDSPLKNKFDDDANETKNEQFRLHVTITAEVVLLYVPDTIEQIDEQAKPRSTITTCNKCIIRDYCKRTSNLD